MSVPAGGTYGFSSAVKVVPLKAPVRYCTFPATLTVKTHLVLFGFPLTGIGNRSGHSQTAVVTPAGPKSLSCVQVFKSGEL